MGVDDVDVLEVEALEGGAEAFDDVFAGEAVVVDEDFAVGAAPVELEVRTIGQGVLLRLCCSLLLRTLRARNSPLL